MKIVFSEHVPDFQNYVFPYHIWGFLEEGEGVRTAYERGFLPVAYDLSRFYLARGIRIKLSDYKVNGRVRYVERKCSHITHQLIERDAYQMSSEVREMAAGYFAAQRVNPEYRQRRFFEMIDSPFCTHLLQFWDGRQDRPAGLVPLLARDGIVHYGIPVYDPVHRATSVGNYMMGVAISRFAELHFEHCYLGTCYSSGDLYKTRFGAMQFFNGYTWSGDRDELHFFLKRLNSAVDNHILGSPDYQDLFCSSDVQLIGERAEISFSVGR